MSSVTIASESPEKLVERYTDYVASNTIWKACKLYRDKDLHTFKEELMPVFQAESNSGKQEARVLYFGEKSSLDSINRMSEIQFCENVLQVSTQLAAPPESYEMLKLAIIGKVMEGEHTAHVVVRYFIEQTDISFQNVEVETVFKEGNTWKLTMPEAMASMGELFQKAMTQS